VLVGYFHTHPGFASPGYDPEPSAEDDIMVGARNVPGLIISEGMKIKPYGPNRRGSDPEIAVDPSTPDIAGYPGNSANTTNCPP
jgi:hypothetical protein